MNILAESDLLVIKEENGQAVNYPLTYSNFRMLFPQTSFPELPDNAFLVDYGYKVFKFSNRPAPSQFVTITDGPIIWSTTLDAYTNTYIETPFTPEQLEQARETALYNQRVTRDRKLQYCDWTQLPDTLLTPEQVEAWCVYRQALRDYLDTVTDPFNPPAWPTPPSPAGDDLASLKAQAIAMVNRDAGRARSKYMTVIPGQEATYLLKEAEAKAWQAAAEPVASDYPILAAEAQACNMTLAATATLVLTTATQFRGLVALIEGLRRGGIVAVESATTSEQVASALAITWP